MIFPPEVAPSRQAAGSERSKPPLCARAWPAQASLEFSFRRGTRPAKIYSVAFAAGGSAAQTPLLAVSRRAAPRAPLLPTLVAVAPAQRT